MITIQNAQLSDLAIIRELAEKIWWPTYKDIITDNQIEFMLSSIYSSESISKALIDQSQTFLLLNENDEPKAFASYGTWNEQPDSWKIHKLYVLPASHGKGFGKDLLNEIKKRARSNGIATLVLNVNRQNPAFNFYQKYGFTVLREEDIPIGPYWMNDFVMMLSIA